MSVKRYNYGFGLLVETEGDGMYVLHSDYATILARHNALCEAVKKERVACEQIGDAIFDGDVSAWAKADDVCDAARAEVDRLLGEE